VCNLGKSFPFEFDIRVPFLVRGPGIGHGRVVHSLVGNVDIAPTFLEIAGLPVPSHMDGASIFRFFQKKTKNRTPWRDTYLIERGKIPPANMPKLNVIEDVPQSNEGISLFFFGVCGILFCWFF
jgi:extracellular sulfatase Sulf